MKRVVHSFVLSFFLLLVNSSSAYCIDNLVADKKGIGEMIFSSILYLVAFIFVLVMTFYGTKLIAKYSKKSNNRANIQVLDQFSFGANRKILVMKIYKKVYILSISNNNTTLIDKLEESDVRLNNDESLDKNRDFEKQLDIFMDKIDNNSEEAGLNNRLVSMKMKVLKLKNNQYHNMDDKEE